MSLKVGGNREKRKLEGISVASLTSPDKEGYLTKQGGSIKTWKKRWCVLKDNTIFYFRTPKDTAPQGTMDLNAQSKCKEVEVKKKKFTFVVCTDTRDFIISADTEAAKQEWMEAVNNCIKALTNGANAPSGGGGAYASENGGDNISTTQTTQSPNGTTNKPVAKPSTTGGAFSGGYGATNKGTTGGASKPGESAVPRQRLAGAKNTIAFLRDEESKVLEFWQIWSESIPLSADLSTGMSIEFHVVTSASMQKLTWRTAGPQNIFIQRMVDFFWNVGAPETEIDRLNDVGALINPIKIGSWIDMSAKGGMDGGWYFPVDISLNLAMEAADAGYPTTMVKEWAQKHSIDKCYSIGRDMGAAPPRQTELRIALPGTDTAAQLRIALDAFDMFGFPDLPENALKILRSVHGLLRLSIITSSEGFVRLGILIPDPSVETVVNLCNIVAGGNKDDLAAFESALQSQGPAYAELQYLMKGFGYSVYKEGFDVVFHYNVGEERCED